jgi:putative acyl-CoA dehydrogenase
MSADFNKQNAPQRFSDALGYATHEVLNQPSCLAEYGAYSDDKPFVEAVTAFGGGWAEQSLRRAGLAVGSAKVQRLAQQANRNLPELRTHDRFGNRIDVVEYHPAYHELMRLIYETQAHSFAWTHMDEAGARGTRRIKLHVEFRVRTEFAAQWE